MLVLPHRNAQIHDLLGEIRRWSTVFAPQLEHSRDLSVVLADLHNRWWDVVQQLYTSGDPTAAAKKFRDWPSFLEAQLEPGVLNLILTNVYQNYISGIISSTGDLPQRFSCAIRRFNLSQEKLLLHLGRTVCSSAAAFKTLSSLFATKKVNPRPIFDSDTVLPLLRNRMLTRHEAAKLDSAPKLSIADINSVYKGTYYVLIIIIPHWYIKTGLISTWYVQSFDRTSLLRPPLPLLPTPLVPPKGTVVKTTTRIR